LCLEFNTSSVLFKSIKRPERCADHPTPFSARIKHGPPSSVPLSAVPVVQIVKVMLEAQDLLNLYTSGFGNGLCEASQTTPSNFVVRPN